MKNTIRQVFHSSKFVAGFVIFVAILLTMLIYPLINPGNPLEQIGVGTFAKPGTYVSLSKAIDEYNTRTYGWTQEELEAARCPIQIMFG